MVKDLPLVVRQQGVDTTDALDRFLETRPDTRLVVVDQLQHLRASDGVVGMAGLEANSRALVALAGKYDVAMVGVSQVNRPEGQYRRADWRPNRYSLRGSEQLFHDAASVLLFHRVAETPGTLSVQVAKGRMGGASENWIGFPYHPETCRVG